MNKEPIKNMERLTHQEERVMLTIWSLKECAVKDILNAIEEPKPNYTTLAAIVRNLEQKDYVYSKRFGNVYVYYPQIKEDDYKKVFINRLISRYFDSSYQNLFSFFVKENQLSTDEIKRIIDIIENEK